MSYAKSLSPETARDGSGMRRLGAIVLAGLLPVALAGTTAEARRARLVSPAGTAIEK